MVNMVTVYGNRITSITISDLHHNEKKKNSITIQHKTDS